MKNVQTILQQTNELKIFAENRARLLLEAQGILYSVKTVGYNFYKDRIFFHFEENVYNNNPSGLVSEIEITAEQLAMNDKDFESLLKKQNMKHLIPSEHAVQKHSYKSKKILKQTIVDLICEKELTKNELIALIEIIKNN